MMKPNIINLKLHKYNKLFAFSLAVLNVNRDRGYKIMIVNVAHFLNGKLICKIDIDDAFKIMINIKKLTIHYSYHSSIQVIKMSLL